MSHLLYFMGPFIFYESFHKAVYEILELLFDKFFLEEGTIQYFTMDIGELSMVRLVIFSRISHATIYVIANFT